MIEHHFVEKEANALNVKLINLALPRPGLRFSENFYEWQRSIPFG
jgi:hypothetical protein